MTRALPLLPAARVLIVEDHPLYLDGLLGLLQRRAPQLSCRTAETAAAALRQLHDHGEVDLVLSDLRLPGGDGLALLAEVGRLFPTVARVLISGSDEPHLADQTRRAGLMGYLPKSLAPVLWELALARILGGEPWFPHDAPPSRSQGPSERQRAILSMLAQGLGNKAMGERMGITERTVKYHLAELYGRLGVANRAQAVAEAGRQGWLRLQATAPAARGPADAGDSRVGLASPAPAARQC